jgi:hypothetical protein
VAWADFDHTGRIVAARAGKLLELIPRHSDFDEQVIADLNDFKPPTRKAPTWSTGPDHRFNGPGSRAAPSHRDQVVNDSFVEALAKELPAEIFAVADGTFVVDIRIEDGRWVTGLVRSETMNAYEADWAGSSEAQRSHDVEVFAALLIIEADAHTNKQWPLWLA